MREQVTLPKAPRVLIVDDEPSILAALRSVLARTLPEANVQIVETAEEAIEWLEKNAIDIIVSDLRIGKGNGLDVLRRARLAQPLAVRILMTAYPAEADAKRVVNDVHLDHFLAKPFHMQEFADLLLASLAARKQFIERLRASPQRETPTHDASAA
jgi:DNA-binding NtrC family response regulator